LFIGMVSKKCNENDIRVMFSAFGQIEECRILRGPDGLSRGVCPSDSRPSTRNAAHHLIDYQDLIGVGGLSLRALQEVSTGGGGWLNERRKIILNINNSILFNPPVMFVSKFDHLGKYIYIYININIYIYITLILLNLLSVINLYKKYNKNPPHLHPPPPLQVYMTEIMFGWI